MQDFWVLLKLYSIFWLKTLERHNFMQWLVVNTLFQEMMDHHSQEDGSRETQKLDPCWKLRLVACMVTMELRLEFGLWAETILTGGLEFLMDPINLWWIRITTTQKFLKISLKNKRYNWMRRILHADQRQKQKQRRELASNSPSIILMNERNWIDIEPGNYSLSAYESSKKVIHLLTFSTSTTRR